MSIEERDDAQQSRPRKVIPGINREGAGQDGDRRAYGNVGYNRSEGNNFERRQYNRQPQNDRGGNNYRSYDRPSYNDYGNNMISSLLIYDINNLKFSTVDFDIVSIKTVYTMNFKYDGILNVVYKDSPNNFCFGKPQYKDSIQYVSLDGNKNNFIIPNNK